MKQMIRYNNSSSIILLLVILAMVLMAVVIQTRLLLHWDVSFLMEATQRFLAGGSYTGNFFETNPPMILYLYIPPVLLMEYLGWSKLFALKSSVFLLSFISVYYCNYFANQLFPKQQELRVVLLSTIAFVFLLLPGHEFGQREHLLTILVMPYLFLVALRMRGGEASVLNKVVVGLMAGLGFTIKPFFMVPLIVVELYYIWIHRNVFACIRTEVIAIICVGVFYLASVFWFFPHYISEVLPILLRLYYPGFKEPFSSLFTNVIVYSCIVFCLFFLVRKNFNSDALYNIFACALFGYLAMYLIEGTSWYYHSLPAFSMAIILCVLVFYFYLKQMKNRHFINVIYFVLAFYLLMYPLAHYCFKTFFTISSMSERWRTDAVSFLKKYPPHTTWDLISTTAILLPIGDQGRASYISRFPNYWWLPGIVNLQKNASNQVDQQKLVSDLDYFVGLVVEDIKQHYPRLIFVDANPYNTQLNSKNIDYIELFSRHPDFKHIWQQYQHVASLEWVEVYEYINRPI